MWHNSAFVEIRGRDAARMKVEEGKELKITHNYLDLIAIRRSVHP